ncbi:uncharacterized protein LOC132266647 [Cornus florida]|uniref:uncharacterized protein LOC132266647 n=1 Tax=Cornus florida TaxID=4283 RepID=UPI00289E0132|nr:uncharacterized protein LOC132266647 [Cornus florida]
MCYSRIFSHSLLRHCRSTYQNPRFQGLTQPKTILFSTSSIHITVNPNFTREYTSSAQESKPAPSERVSAIVDEISGLTLLEASDLTEVLRKKLGINEMPVMAVMMPGMGFGVQGGGKGGGAAKEEEKKVEKTAFDLKLEGGYDAGSKIKIIKEVRACTDLGLKEAKDLVEKAPTLLKKGVTKEEAEKIIEKMKEIGAKVTME